MSEVRDLNATAASHPGAPIDDCWNRIGVRGDGSCPRLAGYIHCRNCPVHDAAAARVLDREQAIDINNERETQHVLTMQSLSERAARKRMPRRGWCFVSAMNGSVCRRRSSSRSHSCARFTRCRTGVIARCSAW